MQYENEIQHVTSLLTGSPMPMVIDNVKLSLRESQCLDILATGKTAKEIAAEIGLSHRTVEHYLENIRNKLGVGNKHELFLKLLNWKLKNLN